MRKLIMPTIIVAALSATLGGAMAQTSTTRTWGPNGSSTTVRIHRGNTWIVRTSHTGPWGMHGCSNATRTTRTYWGGVRRISSRTCH